MKTQKQIKKKYETSKKYQASTLDKTNKYSFYNPFGLYFEYVKFREIVKMLSDCNLNLKDKSILDIGCHRGFHASWLMYLKENSKDVFGIDIIPKFIDKAKELYPNINFKVMDAKNITFKRRFDFVSLIYTLSSFHGKDKFDVAKEISNQVKGGGYLLIFDFLDSKTINSIRYFMKTIKKQPNDYIMELNDKVIKKLFPEFKLIKSKKMIGVLSPKTTKFLPYWAVELIDAFTPKNYCLTILKKDQN
jgi:SAM-dependent methyltransferase